MCQSPKLLHWRLKPLISAKASQVRCFRYIDNSSTLTFSYIQQHSSNQIVSPERVSSSEMSRLDTKGGPSASVSRSSPASATSSKTASYVPPHLRRTVNSASSSPSSSAGPSSLPSYASRNGNTGASPSPSYITPRSGQLNSRSDPSPRDESRGVFQPSRRLGPDSPLSHRGAPGSWSSPSTDRFRSAPASSPSSSATGRSWSKYPNTSHLFISGDSFVGALSPALGPKEEEVDLRDTEQMEAMRIARRNKRVVIDKGKGAAAKVGLGFLIRQLYEPGPADTVF